MALFNSWLAKFLKIKHLVEAGSSIPPVDSLTTQKTQVTTVTLSGVVLM